MPHIRNQAVRRDGAFLLLDFFETMAIFIVELPVRAGRYSSIWIIFVEYGSTVIDSKAELGGK